MRGLGRLDKPMLLRSTSLCTVPRNLNTIAFPPIPTATYLWFTGSTIRSVLRSCLSTASLSYFPVHLRVHRHRSLPNRNIGCLSVSPPGDASVILSTISPYLIPYHAPHSELPRPADLRLPPGSCGTTSSPGLLPVPPHLLRVDRRIPTCSQNVRASVSQSHSTVVVTHSPKVAYRCGYSRQLADPSAQMPPDSSPSLSRGYPTSAKQITTDRQHGSLQNGSQEHRGPEAAPTWAGASAPLIRINPPALASVKYSVALGTLHKTPRYSRPPLSRRRTKRRRGAVRRQICTPCSGHAVSSLLAACRRAPRQITRAAAVDRSTIAKSGRAARSADGRGAWE